MKLLKNPKKGAPISDLWINDVFYFDSKNGDIFKPEMILQFDDAVGKKLKELFGFLEEVSLEEAKQYAEDMKKPFACEYCEFRTDVKIGLVGHMRSHEEVKKEIAFEDIPVVKGSRVSAKVEENTRLKNIASSIENEASSEGLIGEGLVEENVGRIARM